MWDALQAEEGVVPPNVVVGASRVIPWLELTLVAIERAPLSLAQSCHFVMRGMVYVTLLYHVKDSDDARGIA